MMRDSSDDRREVSITALVAAMREESVPEPAIGRVLAAVLGADDATARAYAAVQPPEAVTDVGALHERLVDAQKRGDWAEVVAVLGRIVELESDDRRRARYFYTVAVVQRTELKDVEAALESLEQTLDCDPTMTRAFETQCSILTEQGDWKRLERAHRKMLVRVRGLDDTALEFNLFQGLGVIYRDRLNFEAGAIEAFKAALRLRPDDPGVLAALQALGA